MTTSARHRDRGPGPTFATLRRYGVGAVCGLVVFSLGGYSEPPVGDAGGRSDVASHVLMRLEAVRATVITAAPITFPRTSSASVTTAEGPGASGRGGEDIPGTALAAYQRAASVMAETAPSCELPWTLLAAIGRVESDHGRYGGAALGADGVSRPHILGVALDGTGEVATIRDTDGGRFDEDDVWDRAVGPMQFIPTTWALAGVDGDADGFRDPHDLDDAALAAGVYLCADGGDLSRPLDQRSSVYRYNHSRSYVALVMAYEQRYRTGLFTIGGVPVVSGAVLATAPLAPSHPSPVVDRSRPDQSATRTDRPTRPPTDEPTAGGTFAAAPVEKPVATPTAPTAPTAPAVPAGSSPDLAPAPPDPTPTPDPDPAPAPEPLPAPEHDPQPVPEPGPAPVPEPDPAPVPEPPPSEPGGPIPELTTVSGVWTACDEGFCLDEAPLLLGDPELLDHQVPLDQPAAQDYDTDGVTESLAGELNGLMGRTVTVVVDQQTTGWTVYAIDGLDYLVEVPTTP